MAVVSSSTMEDVMQSFHYGLILVYAVPVVIPFKKERKKERKEGSKKKVASSRLYRRFFFFQKASFLLCSFIFMGISSERNG